MDYAQLIEDARNSLLGAQHFPHWISQQKGADLLEIRMVIGRGVGGIAYVDLLGQNTKSFSFTDRQQYNKILDLYWKKVNEES